MPWTTYISKTRKNKRASKFWIKNGTLIYKTPFYPCSVSCHSPKVTIDSSIFVVVLQKNEIYLPAARDTPHFFFCCGRCYSFIAIFSWSIFSGVKLHFSPISWFHNINIQSSVVSFSLCVLGKFTRSLLFWGVLTQSAATTQTVEISYLLLFSETPTPLLIHPTMNSLVKVMANPQRICLTPQGLFTCTYTEQVCQLSPC